MNEHSSPIMAPAALQTQHSKNRNPIPTGPEATSHEVNGQSPPLAIIGRDSSPFSRNSSRSISRMRRPSFDSVKEEPTDIPQSFAESTQQSSQLPGTSHAQVDGMSTKIIGPAPAPDFFCPCGGFQGWKQIKLGGKRQSKSHSDLRRLLGFDNGWAWNPAREEEDLPAKLPETRSRRPTTSLEDMPFEVLDSIFSYLADEIRPNSYAPRNLDLMSCLLSSRTLHAAVLSVLYRNVTIPHSMTFFKMMNHIQQYPALGTLMRRLDFSHYTSFGFGRTRRASAEIQNITPKTLQKCLELMPNLKEFQVHELIDDELDEDFLKKLFSMRYLHALDFCACSSRSFVTSFTNVIVNNRQLAESIPLLKRLSLHECSTLQDPVFASLIPRLTNLTHLDVSHTLITDEILFSIPHTARLTHLNVGKCTRITGSSVVEFLSTHEAVKNTLVYLNLMCDPSRYRLLYEKDVDTLLPALPSTLRSLNLGGAQITSAHIRSLAPLAKHLEELGLGRANISIDDVNSLFVPKRSESDDDSMLSEEELNWEPSSLRYIDLTGVSAIQHATLFSSACVLVSPHSYPLEVIELGEPVMKQLREREKSNKQVGWVVREIGRRGWFVRAPDGSAADEGRREWKMGARWWGMRKVPVAVQEVGGMYGHYMFKN